MNTIALWTRQLRNALQGTASLLVRGILALGALVFTLGLLLFGLVLGAGLLIWALLRGRRPAGIRFGARSSRRGGHFRGAAGHGGRDVVDIEAREVTVARPRA